MEHLDEGTVHAWLDGALAADERDRVERHVAECAECSAMAAEARGLIAASTRILGALDDVPHLDGGRPTVDGRGARGAPSPPRAPAVTGRRWLRPQFTAAAAIALIALGSLVVVKGRGGAGAGDFAAPSMSSTPPMAERASDATAPDSLAGRVAAAVAAPEMKAADAASANDAAPSPQRAAPLPPPALAPPRVAARALADSAASVAETREQGAMRKAPADVAQRRGDSASTAKAQTLSPALRAGEIARREGERVRGEPLVPRSDAVVTTGAAAEAPAGSRVEAIAGCWVLERTTAAREGGVPERVELLARVVGEVEGRRLYAARPVDRASAEAVEWRWTIGERGEVTLVRGAGDDAAQFPVAVTLASRTGATSVARRLACPAR